MTGMDGFEVLKEIRETKNIFPTILPVIMLSAMEPVDKSVIKSLKSGANDNHFYVVPVALVSLLGSESALMAIIIETPKSAVKMLGHSLPQLSSFFVSFVTINTFVGLGVEIS